MGFDLWYKLGIKLLPGFAAVIELIEIAVVRNEGGEAPGLARFVSFRSPWRDALYCSIKLSWPEEH